MKNMTVYHGSYIEISQPSLDKCRDGKDFGRGFYVTTSREQAERFCHAAVDKAHKNGDAPADQKVGYVSVFQYMPKDGLSIHEFNTADDEWLECVSGHRRRDLFKEKMSKWDEFDIITGKVANDNTNRTITNYINGDYGNPQSDTAKSFAISLLKPDRLSDQECFRTDKALECLEYIESYEVTIK